ncbi:hypothetical protein EEL31_10550 [Brevibacillus laterosporus]|nr:hypothetical protein [Brevibacillus laterosporus]TPG68925.1 hypothetical protein EEL31_10550 [Brevibacillus laterosporus]
MFNTILSEKTSFANETFTNEPRFHYVSSHIVQVFIVRYNFNPLTNSNRWDLVTDIDEAFQIDPNYSLASINDLHDYIAAGGEVFEGILKVSEGYCVWSESHYSVDDDFSEYDSQYTIVDSLCLDLQEII